MEGCTVVHPFFCMPGVRGCLGLSILGCASAFAPLEVAEHLSDLSAGVFVESLTRLGSVVLFSAAIPSQPGTNHRCGHKGAGSAMQSGYTISGIDLVCLFLDGALSRTPSISTIQISLYSIQRAYPGVSVRAVAGSDWCNNQRYDLLLFYATRLIF
jgi:hypothetical protein